MFDAAMRVSEIRVLKANSFKKLYKNNTWTYTVDFFNPKNDKWRRDVPIRESTYNKV